MVLIKAIAKHTYFPLNILKTIFQISHLFLQISHANSSCGSNMRHILLDIQHLPKPRLKDLNQIVQQSRAFGARRLGID